MSKVRVGINGFGRIGRMAARLLWEDKSLELAAINDLTPLNQNAHLLKYDSVHGPWGHDVIVDGQAIKIGNQKIPVYSQKDPSEISWKDAGVDIVLECTGVFIDRAGAEKHLKGGAKKVIISAPTKDAQDVVPTYVMGINHQSYRPEFNVVSNASCTTNCLAPLVKVLHDNFKVQRGLMTTVHSYTNDQRTLDIGHKDMRRARAAALNMIPTSTGAAKAVTLVIPELKGKLSGTSVRVPTPNVSLVDFVADVAEMVTVEKVNDALIRASKEGPLKGILNTVSAELVSSDFNGSPYSSSVDLPSTMVIDGNMVKVFSWYDNETGFTRRMLDLATHIGSSL